MTNEDIRKALVAYAAFHEYIAKGEMDRALCWARMVRDVAHVFEEIGLQVTGILSMAERADEALLAA